MAQVSAMSLDFIALLILVGLPLAVLLSSIRKRLDTSEPSDFARRRIAEMDAELDAIDRETERRRPLDPPPVDDLPRR